MNVKRIATEVVAALPADASLLDLDEFLFERAMVEDGRDDFEAGRVLPNCEVLGKGQSAEPEPPWADHAAASLREAVGVAAGSGDLIATVVSAARRLVGSQHDGISLPEMGDPSIREVHIRVAHIGYRLVYDVDGASLRILAFTNKTTCYRNVRPLSVPGGASAGGEPPNPALHRTPQSRRG